YQPEPHGRSLVPGPESTAAVPSIPRHPVHNPCSLGSTFATYPYTQSSTRKTESGRRRRLVGSASWSGLILRINHVCLPPSSCGPPRRVLPPGQHTVMPLAHSLHGVEGGTR